MAATQTPARLKQRYLDEIRPALVERFGYTSVMQAPRIEKITVNMGVGDAKQDSKLLEAACGAAIGVLVAFLAAFALERIFDTPSAVRFLLLGAAALACALVPLAIYRWVWRRRRLDQLARLLSRAQPSFGDQLLGVIELVQSRRAETLHDAAHVDHGCLDDLAQVQQPVVESPLSTATVDHLVAQQVDAEGQGGEGGTEAVMQLPAYALALLLATQHEALLGGAQLVDESGRVHDGAELSSEVVEEGPVGLAHPATRPAQQPDLCAVRRHGQLVDPLGRLPVPRHQ